MTTKILLISLIGILFISCSSDKLDIDDESTSKVLMLTVDYSTRAFEGGTEFGFLKQSDNFTIINEYEEPSDFGSIKLIYKEFNETLLEGTIHWMGVGERMFPKSLKPAKDFDVVLTDDYVFPESGFENVFNPNNVEYDYQRVWSAVQSLVKVRQYLNKNPVQKVKLFLYTPSVGPGDPIDWVWIIYLKQ